MDDNANSEDAELDNEESQLEMREDYGEGAVGGEFIQDVDKADEDAVKRNSVGSAGVDERSPRTETRADSDRLNRFRGGRTRSYRNRENMEHEEEPTNEENGSLNEEDDSSWTDMSDSSPIFEFVSTPDWEEMSNEEGSNNLEAENVCTAVLNKPKPKHKWFIVPEIINRQIGTRANKRSSELFQRRCYGSLHCVQRLELMYKLEKHEGCVNSLNFHPSGHLLASGSDDLQVVIWDWKNGRQMLSYETKHHSNVFQSKFLELSGDLHIVTCGRDGQVRLAQVSAQEGLRSTRKLGSHQGPSHKLSVLLNQPQVVISVGEDGLILRHDLRCPKSEKILIVNSEEGREIALYSISSHPLNGNEFCVAGKDYMVRVYDQRQAADKKPLSTFQPFEKLMPSQSSLHITCAVYNHNGKEILASYSNEGIYLFDVNGANNQYIHHYMGHKNRATIKGVNFFGPKSEFVMSGSDCGNIYFWERETESIVQWLLADDNGVVNCLEPHPQLPFLCTSGLDWDVKVWVPSYEQDPQMEGLAKRVKGNILARQAWSDFETIDDTQILWTLWRQLNGREQLREFRRVYNLTVDNPNADSESSSSSSSSDNSPSEHSDDNWNGPTGCSPS